MVLNPLIVHSSLDSTAWRLQHCSYACRAIPKLLNLTSISTASLQYHTLATTTHQVASHLPTNTLGLSPGGPDRPGRKPQCIRQACNLGRNSLPPKSASQFVISPPNPIPRFTYIMRILSQPQPKEVESWMARERYPPRSAGQTPPLPEPIGPSFAIETKRQNLTS